jgi:hypothetical protein
MKILFAILATLTLGWFFTPGHSTYASAFDVQDQINKTVTLAPGSNVRVSGINGSVVIETSDSDRAEINIQIKASSQEAMERRPIVVENTSNSLTIRAENDREGRRFDGDRGWVRHEVRLRLPRAISLKVSGVNGKVEVGQITGEVAVNGVNGRVDVAQAGTATELSGINGHTSVAIKRVGEGGLRVSGINGGVEIGLPAGTNADVEVRSVNGGINSDIPLQVQGEMRRGQLIGKMGSGGAQITVSGINGGVTLRGN